MLTHTSFHDRLTIPRRTTTAKATGEVVPAYDSASQPEIKCKFILRSARSMLQPYGNEVEADGIVLFRTRELDVSLSPLLESPQAGTRTQVWIESYDPIQRGYRAKAAYEVLSVRDSPVSGEMKMAIVKRRN